MQLTGAVAVPGWGGSFSVDDAYTTLSLPMSVTMYGYTTSTVSVTTNGVSNAANNRFISQNTLFKILIYIMFRFFALVLVLQIIRTEIFQAVGLAGRQHSAFGMI